MEPDPHPPHDCVGVPLSRKPARTRPSSPSAGTDGGSRSSSARSRGRVEVIAQHQLGMLHAQAQRERTRAVGVTEFVWRTHGDAECEMFTGTSTGRACRPRIRRRRGVWGNRWDVGAGPRACSQMRYWVRLG